MFHPLKSLYSLEELSKKKTFLHRLSPGVKFVTTVLFIFISCSFYRYNVSSLIFLSSYPILLSVLAEIPIKTVFQRILISLPFCVFMGASGSFINTFTAIRIGEFHISFGVLSFIVILFRTVLSVSMITILIATTPFHLLTKSLLRLKVPRILILIIEMFYRYLGVVFIEKSTNMNAYYLRSNQKRGIHIKNAGSFVGLLFIRNVEKAKKIYFAMRLRGYRLNANNIEKGHLNLSDIMFFVIVFIFLMIAKYFFSRF